MNPLSVGVCPSSVAPYVNYDQDGGYDRLGGDISSLSQTSSPPFGSRVDGSLYTTVTLNVKSAKYQAGQRGFGSVTYSGAPYSGTGGEQYVPNYYVP